MAIWQYELLIVTREDDALRRGQEDVTLPEELEDLLVPILPQMKSWSESIKLFGTEDGNRIDLVYEDHQLIESHVRFDLRHPNREFFGKVIGAVRNCACIFEDEEGHRLEPDAQVTIAEMMKSNAASWIQDPEAFLNRLHKEDSQ